MVSELLSVIIPDRQGQPYLQQTVDSLLANAEGDIEILVVCDGLWPNPMLTDDPRVSLIYHGTPHNNLGMRESINKGVALSKGKYLFKIDEQCIVDKGYDTKLKADCDDNWIVIPRRYRLDWDTFEIDRNDSRPPIDYMFLAYPYERPNDKTCGLHGSEWKERYNERKDILIDDTMSWQGSAYFMTRKHWDTTIKELDTEHYGTFTQEAQELGNKTWFSGGRLVVNKKTWYAHGHKGKRGKGYGFSNEQYQRHMEGTERGRLYCIEYWLHTKDYQYDFEWLLNKFAPVPTWPSNWKERIEVDKLNDYSRSEYHLNDPEYLVTSR